MDFTDPTSANFNHPGGFISGGDLAIGTGASAPSQQISVGHITGSGGIIVSYSNPNINIDGSGAGGSIVWNIISSSQTLANQNGYFCSGGGTLSLLLPPISVLGDTIEITIDGSAGFHVTQGAGQSIKFGNQITTAGVGGSIASTGQGDTIRMVCKTANLAWNIVSCMGNLTFV
jgi:hypothetical protein